MRIGKPYNESAQPVLEHSMEQHLIMKINKTDYQLLECREETVKETNKNNLKL